MTISRLQPFTLKFGKKMQVIFSPYKLYIMNNITEVVDIQLLHSESGYYLSLFAHNAEDPHYLIPIEKSKAKALSLSFNLEIIEQ
jgi:hypothetical protein